MRKLAVLVIATVVAIAYAGADAAEKAHRRHAANPPKNPPRPSSVQPAENPPTRLPVPVDTFRA